MLGDLPDYNSRIKKRVFLFTVLLLLGFACFVIQRRDRAQVRPSTEMKTGLKVLTDPEAVAKDL
jgi:hypothetical protein